MTSHNDHSDERYGRQVILKNFGETAQKKLLDAKVLVVGAGGLGCPALLYLAAGGVGTLGIADYDAVSLSNLHRQVLFKTNDIGHPKAEKAAAALRELNPEIEIKVHNLRLSGENALEIIRMYDIILDGTDNFSTRYMINDACVLLNRTLVFGAISGFEGQVAVFNGTKGRYGFPVNYRDLFPELPADDEILNCAETGVLGVTTGIIGNIMAAETIKIITGVGEPLVNKLLSFDTLSNRVYEMDIEAAEGTSALVPENEEVFRDTDYIWLCSSQAKDRFEIDNENFNRLIPDRNVTVVDVREAGEKPVVDEFEFQHIPLGRLQDSANQINGNTIILFCQTGQRSLAGAKILEEIFGGSKKIYSLKGGILSRKK